MILTREEINRLIDRMVGPLDGHYHGVRVLGGLANDEWNKAAATCMGCGLPMAEWSLPTWWPK